MAKVYTKTGDKGMTTLYGGSTVKKTSKRVNAYGAIDEANSFIGLAAAHVGNEDLEEVLRICQKKLFIIGAEMASDSRGARMLKDRIVAHDAMHLEQLIDAFSAGLPESKEFKIPGKTIRSGHLHVARSMVRRAERLTLGVKEEIGLNQDVLIYLNRLSDFLFVLTRAVDELDMF